MLRAHRKVEEQGAGLWQQQKVFEAKFAAQQKQIEALTAIVQRVIDEVARSKPAPQLVATLNGAVGKRIVAALVKLVQPIETNRWSASD